MGDKKKCTKCGEEKEFGDFYKEKAKKDGYKSLCKKCVSKTFKIYREKNKEKISINFKNWASNNRDRINKNRRKRLANNPEALKKERKRQREWKLQNKNKIKESSILYYKNNIDKIKDYRIKNRDTILHKMKKYHRFELYGLEEDDYNSLLLHQKGKCAICGRSIKLHIDHKHDESFPKGKCSKEQVRGLLCTTCNTGIGLLREDVGILNKAIEYINNPPAKAVLCLTEHI